VIPEQPAEVRTEEAARPAAATVVFLRKFRRVVLWSFEHFFAIVHSP
jgi:hypothetical protein